MFKEKKRLNSLSQKFLSEKINTSSRIENGFNSLSHIQIIKFNSMSHIQKNSIL